MTRILSAIVVLSLGLGANVSAQTVAPSALRASIDREVARLASVDVATPGVVAEPAVRAATQPANNLGAVEQRTDDWGAVQKLVPGTRVRVATRNGREIIGPLTLAGEDRVELVARGRTESILRDDVWAVRLPHGLSVPGYLGLGILAGGVTGLLVGSAASASCDRTPGCDSAGALAIAGGVTLGPFLGGMTGFVTGQIVHHRPERVVYARRSLP
jgi:hypothetical protein